jgi:site-specific DNA recombinase
VALRLDGYVRVSRVGGREGEGYISPSVQREAIEAYAKELDGKVVAWHDDQDYSGGNTERPGFQAALERLREDRTDGLVVMRVDRFARSVADGAAIVREIVEAEKTFAACHERIDPTTPEGKFMLTSFLANAELFLDRAKANWNTAKAKAVARGAHIGPTPIGYNRVEKGRERAGCLVPDPLYGPAITELFRRAASGEHGDTALARWMTERAPRRGGASWQSSEVRRWFGNRIYLGEIRYGELLNPDAHEPLTDAATWQAVQRAPGRQRRSREGSFLLAGLVRCANCRYAMTGQRSGGAKGETPVYRCPDRGRCDSPSVITAERLDGYVRELVLEQVEGLRLEAVEEGVDLEAVDAAYEAAEAELQAFAADVNARRTLGESGWQDSLAARALERDTQREAREQGYAAARLESVVRDAGDLDEAGFRDLLGGMVRHIFVRRRGRGASVDDRALVIWSDDPRAVDVPGPHRSGIFEPVRW